MEERDLTVIHDANSSVGETPSVKQETISKEKQPSTHKKSGPLVVLVAIERFENVHY
jgi:hypothetical protein